MACGPAGLVVIDLDAGAAPPALWAERGVGHGRDVLAVLAADAGQPVPDTYTVATATGEHLYFTAPAGLAVRNTAGALGWRIDTRGAGGYVVAAGSVLRRTGRTLPYRVVHDRPVAPLPDWITTALTTTAAPTQAIRAVLAPTAPAVGGPVPGEPGGIWTGRIGAYLAAAVAGETRAVARARLGTRNHTLFRAAASLGELIGAGLLDETAVTAALLTAARGHIGVDGFTPAEAHRAIANGLARGRRNPRHLTG